MSMTLKPNTPSSTHSTAPRCWPGS